MLRSNEAVHKFSEGLFEKMRFKSFYSQLLDVPEFPTELDDIDEGFNSICIKSSDGDTMKNSGKDQPQKQKISHVQLKSLEEQGKYLA
jgi:hypothetical protein